MSIIYFFKTKKLMSRLICKIALFGTYLYTKVFVVYLKFKFNWSLSIFISKSGNIIQRK